MWSETAIVLRAFCLGWKGDIFLNFSIFLACFTYHTTEGLSLNLPLLSVATFSFYNSSLVNYGVTHTVLY